MQTPQPPPPPGGSGEPLIERMRRTLREQEAGDEEAAKKRKKPRETRREPTIRRKEPARTTERIEREKQAVRPDRRARQTRQADVAGAVRPEQPEPLREPERRTRRRVPHEPDRPEQAAPEAPPVPPPPPTSAAPAPAGEGETDPIAARLAARLAALRNERDWSLQDLTDRTGISRSTLSRIERGEVSPTAAVLLRLAAAYGLTLAGLLAEVEEQPRSLVRAAEQPVTGEDAWRRRIVSPPYPGLAGSVVDAVLLPGTDVTYDPPVSGAEQHLWLITGSLEVTPRDGGGAVAGDDVHSRLHRHGIDSDDGIDPRVDATPDDAMVLIRGDCLRLRLWGPARLRCLSPDAARYALFTVTP